MRKSEMRRKGSTTKGLEEFVEGVGLETNDDVILRRDNTKRRWYRWSEGDLQQVVHHSASLVVKRTK
jgi:hypothetical protein